MDPMSFKTGNDVWVPRPSQRDDSILLEASLAFKAEIRKTLGINLDVDDEDLVRFFRHSFNCDGFELAKAMEDEFHIIGCMGLCEILDNFYWQVYQIAEKAMKSWVEINDVKPDHKIGDKVTWEMTPGRDTEFLIVGIDKCARYTLFSEAAGHVRTGEGTHGFLVEFEKVRVS